MKRKILLRCLVGGPIGIAITCLTTLLISFGIGDGNYYPIVPELAEICGGELNAVAVQMLCAFLYGAVWGGASVIWEADNWSLLRMTLTHSLICSLVTFPVAYFLHWMPHNVAGILIYFGIFFAIYLSIWFSMYMMIRGKIRRLNAMVDAKKK